MTDTTYFRLTMPSKKSNGKTGPIPVSTTSSHTCWNGCAAFQACYAKGGPTAIVWKQTDAGQFSTNLQDFVAKVSALPENQVWRHNQAGDLPGVGAAINKTALNMIVEANSGKRGFTYTHKPMDDEQNRDAVAAANKAGFTINLSANNLAHADQLSDLGIGPVVTLLSTEYQRKSEKGEWTETVRDYQQRVKTLPRATPKGKRMAVCPATYLDDTQCANCGNGKPLCQRVERDYLVGFPGHGARAKSITAIAQGE